MFDELVDAVNERPVVEHVVGVDRVADPVVAAGHLVDERQAVVLGRGAALAQEKEAVRRRRAVAIVQRRRRRRRGRAERGEGGALGALVEQQLLGRRPVDVAVVVVDGLVDLGDLVPPLGQLELDVLLADCARKN